MCCEFIAQTTNDCAQYTTLHFCIRINRSDLCTVLFATALDGYNLKYFELVVNRTAKKMPRILKKNSVDKHKTQKVTKTQQNERKKRINRIKSPLTNKNTKGMYDHELTMA